MNVPIGAKTSLKRRVTAVINTGSGSAGAQSAADMETIFADAGLSHAKVVSVTPSELEQALDAAAAEADVVVVLGGDGTINAAAAKCGAAGKLLAPLPGGTMNMLPHALYGNVSWQEALKQTLAAPAIREVSGGKAEGHPFFCAAILGAPSLWAEAREALRHGDLIETVRRAITAIRRHHEALSYRLGDELTGKAEAVAVICPLVSHAMDETERSLEAAALDPSTAGSIFRLAFHAIFDDWRQDPSVSLAKVKTVRVTGHGKVPVILDGERVSMGRAVNVTFEPLAFRALAPAAPKP